MRKLYLVLIALSLPAHPTSPALAAADKPAHQEADVVVYGATASGVLAAVAVAREGKTVLLVEPGKHVGGMVSGGLGATDTGNRGAIGGYSREFFERVRAYYTKKDGPMSAQVKACSDGFHFEPHVATLVFKAMLEETRIEVKFGHRLDKVAKKDARIVSFTSGRGDTFTGKVFIDASYEGDLMAKAGVSYTVGREARDTYKESIAGVQARSPAHQWPVAVSAFEDKKMLLPFVQAGSAGEPGAGDRKVQAYNFRLCMTDRKDNQVPFPKPEKYDPKRYELLARYLEKRPTVKVGQLMNPVRMPNGKTDTNNNGPFSTDHIGANWDYPDADYAAREKIWQDHINYTQGFLYFLANDTRVPADLQKEMQSWGLAKDEFTDTKNWPHQLYVREARRMLGVYVMTQADIMDKRTKEDSVGLGSYTTDSHHVQRIATKEGAVLNEGDFQVGVSPYAIPYRSLLPRAEQCENLLVPVCLSASHVAYGTIRMEPVYMVLGQASGVGAALAVEEKSTVQKIPTEKLLARLQNQKAVLSPAGLAVRPSPVKRLDPAKMAGKVIDNSGATLTGDWQHSSTIGPIVGEDYLHDGNQGKGKYRARFTPNFTEAGKYEVRLYYPPASNRASNTLVVIQCQDGEKMIRVDQRKSWEDNGVVLGVFNFEAGKGWVEVRNDGTDGHVIADAVQWVGVK